MVLISTQRLILRTWKSEGLEPYAEMNADPVVREFFPSVLTREQSEAELRHIRERYERDGFCLFAAELIAGGALAGFVGMQRMSFEIPGVEQPAVEIGWRLRKEYWGKGLATEGARAVVRYAFEMAGLRRLVAITVPTNVRSRRVMEKIGMRHVAQLDFDHPRIAEGHPLRRHVVYLMEA